MVPQEDAEVIAGVAKSIMKINAKKITEIFHHEAIVKWLNQEIPEYEKMIDTALNGCEHSIIRNAFSGHKKAYKHIRGFALCEAIVEHIHEIHHSKIDDCIYDLLESSDLALSRLNAMNTSSIHNIIVMHTETEHT